MIDRAVELGHRLMHPRTLRGRLARDAARLAGLAIVLFVWWLLTFNDYQHDAGAYWGVDLDTLPWGVFAGVWAALNLGALLWMAGPAIAGLLLVVPGSPVIDEVGTGNIHLMLAAAIVLAFRWPVAWALPLLTKVTPGVGVLWLAGAQRWRALAIALGATVGIVLVSFALGPQLWFDWIDVLTGNVDRQIPTEIAIIPGPLWARTALGAGVAIAGGWRGWRWTVPVAATLALPVPWSSGLTVLVAIIALVRAHLKQTPER
jgi:Glycosyltransferase family 87